MSDELNRLVDDQKKLSPADPNASPQDRVDPDRNSDYRRQSDEALRLDDALRNATPSVVSRLRDQVPDRLRFLDEPRRTDFDPAGQVVRHPVPPPFPERESAAQTLIAGAGSVPDIAFIASDASNTEGDPPVENNRVLVADGKIKGQFPAGMGSGNYILDLADPADSLIYAGATFDPSTSAITSRFLGVSGSGDFPESRVESSTSGFLYWLLAFTYFDVDGIFQVINARVGNINFEPTYGVLNTRPALWIDNEIGFLDLDAIYPP